MIFPDAQIQIFIHQKFALLSANNNTTWERERERRALVWIVLGLFTVFFFSLWKFIWSTDILQKYFALDHFLLNHLASIFILQKKWRSQIVVQSKRAAAPILLLRRRSCQAKRKTTTEESAIWSKKTKLLRCDSIFRFFDFLISVY